MPSGVYLLHINPPYKHARHYLGYADDLQRRIAEQQTGRRAAARLPQVVIAAGCTLVLARIWPGQDRHFERKLKQRKNTPCLCPICNGQGTALNPDRIQLSTPSPQSSRLT